MKVTNKDRVFRSLEKSSATVSDLKQRTGLTAKECAGVIGNACALGEIIKIGEVPGKFASKPLAVYALIGTSDGTGLAKQWPIPHIALIKHWNEARR